MRTLASTVLLALCLLAPARPGQAQPATGQPAPQPASSTPAKAATPSTARSDAAEARYRAWVEKEHAQDAGVFQKEKSKIEDKYKGYVRPKREKKDAKDTTAPAKGSN